jgi:hypothetical protein
MIPTLAQLVQQMQEMTSAAHFGKQMWLRNLLRIDNFFGTNPAVIFLET